MRELSSLKTKLAELEGELKSVNAVNEGRKIQINGTFRQTRVKMVGAL